MRSIIEACFSRPGAVILALILIFFAGFNAYFSIPKEAAPDVEIPVAYVSVAYEGISPADAEKWKNAKTSVKIPNLLSIFSRSE